MYNLYLDDTRMPKDSFGYMGYFEYMTEDWVIARNFDEFVKIVKENGIPEMISFDHDLADQHYGVHDHLTKDEYDLYTEKTGYHCAKWFIDYCIDNNFNLPKMILIHSMNTAGALNIKSLFDTYKKIYGK